MYYKIRTILEESLPIQIVCAAISLCAGFLWNQNNEILFSLPGIFVVLPSFVNACGSVISIFSCRISSALHMGTIKPIFKRTKTLNKNIVITFFDSFVSFLALGFIGNIFNMILGVPSVGFFILPLVTLVAGLLTLVVLSLLSIIFSYVSFSRGIDPDNINIPVLTSVGDVVSVFLLFLVLGLMI